MIIHSVTPLEMLTPPVDLPSFEMRAFDKGMLQGYQDGDGFVIRRVISTDPSVYLNQKYAPGSLYSAPQS